MSFASSHSAALPLPPIPNIPKCIVVVLPSYFPLAYIRSWGGDPSIATAFHISLILPKNCFKSLVILPQ